MHQRAASWRAAFTRMEQESRSHWRIIGVAALVFVVTLVSRLPVTTDYLVNWDSVQFALATEGFDLDGHRPHPPGYIGYIAAGWVLNHLTGDANTSFVLMSVIAGAAAPAIFLVLAKSMMSWQRALIATVLFAASPLLWYYSGVALTYTVEAALAVLVALFLWKGRQSREARWLILGSLLLAMLGAVRQTGLVLLLPMWVWALIPADFSARRAATVTLAAASAVWLIPLLWIANGPIAYIRSSMELAELTGGSTSVISSGFAGLSYNSQFVAVSLACVFGATALLLVWPATRSRLDGYRAIRTEKGQFLALWTLPALAVFVLMHMGQAGYVLAMSPAIFLGIGLILPEVSQRQTRFVMGGVGAVVAINALLIYVGPALLYDQMDPEGANASAFRQYSAKANDEYWGSLTEFVRRHDPETTVVLALPGGPRSSAAFRHFGYYLEEYRVYGAGYDRHGRFGLLFAAHEGEDNYSIGQMENAMAVLSLAPEVRSIVVTEPWLADQLSLALDLHRFELSDGQAAWRATVRGGMDLVFEARERPGDFRVRAMPWEISPIPWLTNGASRTAGF